MSCPCCGKESEVCKISYDIYPLIPTKKIAFPLSLFKKDSNNTNGIKKEALACIECIEEASILLKSGRPNFNSGVLVTELEKQNPGMIVCHIERIYEKEKPINNIKISKPLEEIKKNQYNKPSDKKSDSNDLLI